MSSDSVVRQKTAPAEIPFSLDQFGATCGPLSVVVVAADPEIRAAMSELLRKCSLQAISASGLGELQSVCTGAAPTACLCGFDVADGTFHDVVEYFEEQPVQIPVIMVSPRTGGEGRSRVGDSVTAGALVRAGALATICYPYRLTDVQIMLWFAIQHQRESQRPSADEQSNSR
jgi:DNA-binding NtrC family response regulator